MMQCLYSACLLPTISEYARRYIHNASFRSFDLRPMCNYADLIHSFSIQTTLSKHRSSCPYPTYKNLQEYAKSYLSITTTHFLQSQPQASRHNFKSYTRVSLFQSLLPSLHHSSPTNVISVTLSTWLSSFAKAARY